VFPTYLVIGGRLKVGLTLGQLLVFVSDWIGVQVALYAVDASLARKDC
jgi:hypothetical protein